MPFTLLWLGQVTDWVFEIEVYPEARTDAMATAVRALGGRAHFVEVTSEGEIYGRLPKPAFPVVAYGSVGIERLAARQGWVPGTFGVEDAFAVADYAPKLGEDFLNAAGQKMTLSLVTEFMRKQGVASAFLRPSNAGKAFAGRVVERDELADWIAAEQALGGLETDLLVWVAPPCMLRREWRTVVIKDRVVAASLYRDGGARRLSVGAPADVLAFAAATAGRVAPAEASMLDIGLTDAGLRVVEFNPFNSSDLYEADAGAVVNAISELAAAMVA